MSLPEHIEAALEAALAKVEFPTAVVSYHLPSEVREWAEQRGLEARSSKYAPRGQLYIVGSVRVEWIPERIADAADSNLSGVMRMLASAVAPYPVDALNSSSETRGDE